jgi:hypothetical protein
MKRFLIVLFVGLMLCIPNAVQAKDDTPDFGIQVMRQPGVMKGESGEDLGTVEYWNTSRNFIIEFIAVPEWQVTDVQIYAGEDMPPIDKKGKPAMNLFPCKREIEGARAMAQCSLKVDLDHSWGGDQTRRVAIHGDLVRTDNPGVETSFWVEIPGENLAFPDPKKGSYFETRFYHPLHGQFIDSPVLGLRYETPTHWGMTARGEDEGSGGFGFFPGEAIDFWVGGVHLGQAEAAKKVTPMDLFDTSETGDARVVGMARLLQSLDDDHADGLINIRPVVAACLDTAVANFGMTNMPIDWASDALVGGLIAETIAVCTGNPEDVMLTAVSAEEAQANLEAGLSQGGIFRKNISKTEDFGEGSQKLEIMPVYIPGMRSDGTAPICCIDDPTTEVDETEDCTTTGIPYEEWRTDLDGDGKGEVATPQCDPRVDLDGNGVADGDDGSCVITTLECRDVAKPILVTYLEKIDIYDDQVTTDFWPGRFSWDVYTAVSRDDGTTWKRLNVSRMADMSSFDLETGEPFPGTSGSPYLKVDDNQILVVWESKFCKSGNPRYSITNCELHPEDCTDTNNDGIGDSVCKYDPDLDTDVCEPDYPYDNPYYVTDIWGVRGQQQSVDYNEVDDVAELGIGEIPYSCLWAARGVIATAQEMADATFASMTITDDNGTVDDTTDDYVRAVELGDIVWYKPERITSGRRDVYIPTVSSARGAGFAIAWQEDPSGLRPGKGKGPGEGWSGAISNHKTDIWYTYISHDDFSVVDANFLPGGPPEGGGPDDKPGLGRPKALVPFSLPVRISDNDMVNTDTLKVVEECSTPEGSTEEMCFPMVENGTFTPIDPEEIAVLFCDHPDANQDTCCDPEDHSSDPRCEDLKGLYGNLTGTKRYAYMALSVDDNADGVPDYAYYEENGGTLNLCDTSGDNSFMDTLPGDNQERWFGFTNVAGDSKLVCVSSDGRLLDGDVSASRPMLQLQPYTKPDGSKSAWALLAYEESKGMGHSLAAEEHLDTDNPVDEIIGDSGQDKPVKQDIGKNLLYHSFDFTQPDLVAPGHIVNLPALCGGLYPTYCDDPDNPTCTCEPGEPVPLYFDYWVDNGDGTGEWVPDESQFLQFRTEIARRARFIVQSPGKVGDSDTLGAIIFKQGQEGQGRPADVFIRRIVNGGDGNPYQFDNFECTTYLDETFDLPACPNDGEAGYNCNVWGEATGDRLCGGYFTDANDGYVRRDHINLTSHDIDASVPVGLDDLGTPEDPTDDVYARDKVLLWSQHPYNLGNESYGELDEECTDDACPGMYSKARSHRGFIRGDFLVTAFSMSPNWAAGRNGNDRYNFYIRRSFDGGQTWTTNPDGDGVYLCPEYRTDPTLPDEEGTGNLPPMAFDTSCGTFLPVPEGELPPLPVGIAMTRYDDAMSYNPNGVMSQYIGPGQFEPARNVSEIGNNKESSGDPRVGATPPTYPLDGTTVNAKGNLVNLCPSGPTSCTYVEDEYVDNIFFVAWGTVDNPKTTGSEGAKPEGAPLDLYYTRTENYGDTYLKIPWVVNGTSSNLGYGETVWRYPRHQGLRHLPFVHPRGRRSGRGVQPLVPVATRSHPRGRPVVPPGDLLAGSG